ncbi:23S rRNA (guanosine(2251)-2'-O)-methyltransferase RlmB [Mycoplasma struthionis]|uniref:23S rRNA (Guanosine(2251)-2'-O)-methyltransferase RlmB n=1 Tax=Mycoplasma struthionis TaxID=538220 RepID=A0A502M9K7_9MOLU|nr:23S rRNA (guanosine(2251)-2'-O)-methyltransferase RlmB [Mycoplasma struthionis]TPI03091.1 23S rRNA (guanosine(2251)-2'-O)-methyltransferase RlmB [Mycoplasma struthionis]
MKNYIFGKNSVLEALEANYPIKKIYLLNGLKNTNLKFKNIEYLPLEKLNKLVKGNHQGYIAEIDEFKYDDLGVILKDKAQNVLMLDHIQDPQNFGAIMRSCSVFNIKHIIIPKDRACDVTATVLKTSSGGFRDIKVIKVASLFDALKKLKENGFWVYATALNKNASKLHKTTFNNPCLLIMGNEANGVSNTLLKHSDQIVYIEQDENSVQSLNVSVATGILLYELTKK